MAAGARSINMDILFTNRKLSTIHSEPVLRITSKANTYTATPKRIRNYLVCSERLSVVQLSCDKHVVY